VRELPSGTVTFLFTDIEGSTRLLHELGDTYADVLRKHRRVLREAFARHGGVEVDTQGDAFFVAFGRASDALAAAREAQAVLSGPIRVRMGVHTGEPLVTDEGYVGVDVHRAARIAAAGHGGQVLVSQSTRQLVGADGLRDLGEHRLKDLTAPERIFQLGDGEFPPLKSLDHTNLPLVSSALVGRDREVDELVGLLSDGARLVTLTGPGGTGKTRLALQVAAELVPAFDDVWFVPLAPLKDSDLVVPTVAQTVGATGGLPETLRERRTLLVLDNFEHVVAASPAVGELLGQTETLRVLATSRTPLRIGPEQEVPLEPLADEDAATLFVERARAGGRRLEIDDAVVEVCRRVDGLPLAVELAAARTKLLDPSVLLQRLDQRLPLLTGGRRDVPDRQRTLRDTIAWSYELLDTNRQSIFERLAIFVGGFSIDAAEQVCEATLEDLAALLDASLLKSRGTGRFLMLETIREYGLEQLRSSGEADDVSAKSAAYFLQQVEEAAPQLVGGASQSEWFARLEEDVDNIRATLQFFRTTGDAAAEFRVAVATWEFWWNHGYVHEGRQNLLHVLDGELPANRAGLSAVEGAGYLAYLEHDRDDAERWAHELLALARRVGDPVQEANAWHAFALLSESEEERLALDHRALELAGDDPVARYMAESLAITALRRGEYGQAKTYLERTRSISETIDDRSTLAGALILLSFVSLAEADDVNAASLLAEGARLGQEIGDVTPMISERCWIALARILDSRGKSGQALEVLGAAERMREETGALPLAGFTWELHEQAVTLIRSRVGARSVSRAWDEGRQKAGHAFLNRVLDELDAPNA
jgi:predicted ATPase